MSKLRKFSTAVYTKEIVLKDPSPEDTPTRVAPRRPLPSKVTELKKDSEKEGPARDSEKEGTQEVQEVSEPERSVAATPIKMAAAKD